MEITPPGTIEGEGNSFKITNSEYLNVGLESSEPVKIRMESIPEMIMITLESISSAKSAEIILFGLAPSTTYYKYQDDYHNLETFVSDENGDYTYSQDLSVPHFIFIQTQKSTKFIKDDATGGDCASIGIWDANTKTCTLNADLNETIQIDSDSITLDGDGHEISGGNTGSGIYFREKFGITIKNTTLRNFSQAISFRYSYQNILNNNSISNTHEGISGWYSANNILSKNKFLSNRDGICLYYSDNNNLSNNTILNNNYDGVGFYNSSNNTFVGNTVSNNHYSGMGLYTSNANTIIDNIILNNGFDGLSFYDSAENKVSGNNISNGGSDGVPLYNSYNNIFSKNIISNNFGGDGVPLYNSYNNIFTDNVVSNNEGGIILYYSNNNKIYNNNFLDNATQAGVYNSIGNIFNLNLPVAGNYWKDFDTPADGCNDVNNNHVCDSPYIFSGGQDNLPWIKSDGWKIFLNQPPTFSNLNQYKSDGITEISEGDITTEDNVVFKANISAPVGEYHLYLDTQDTNDNSTINSFSGLTQTGLISDYSLNYNNEPGTQTEAERIVAIPDIIQDIEISYNLGWINKETVKNLFITKLKVVQQLINQRDKEPKYKEKLNKIIAVSLNLFIKEIEFYNEKGFVNDQAMELLINGARYIINHL